MDVKDERTFPVTIRILIINEDSAEVDTIKSWLEKDMRFPWDVHHCISVEKARSFINKTDLVILKPQMEGALSPQEVFKHIKDMVFEMPILVLANSTDEHGLATFVMEQGAADTVIRGQFARLVDAIEFSLIRQKTQTGMRETADKTLSDSQDQNKADLKISHDENVARKERHKQILRMFSGDYSVDQ